MTEKFLLILTVLGVNLLSTLPVHGQPQSRDRQTCINSINSEGAKVAAAQAKENLKCLKDAGKAELVGTAQECLVADRKGRVFKRSTRTFSSVARRCTEDGFEHSLDVPDFGFTNGTEVNESARVSRLALTEDVFGPDVDAAIVACDQNRDACNCQANVLSEVNKIATITLKEFLKCKKTALRAGGGIFPLGAASAADLRRCVDDPATARSIAADTNLHIANRILRLQERIALCDEAGVTAGAFPGVCDGLTGSLLATCFAKGVTCRSCEMINNADGLNADCDLLDNGSVDGSCMRLPRRGEFQVNTYATSHQNSPTVSLDSDGDFVVAWRSSRSEDHYGGIYAQRHDETGYRVGAEFHVNTFTLGNQGRPDISVHSDGNFVVVWDSDGSGASIFGQRYDSAGDQLGTEFQINESTADFDVDPEVSMSSTGGFVVAWSGRGAGSEPSGVLGQLFDSAGNKLGSEFQVNTHPPGVEAAATVSMAPTGEFVVAWESVMQDGDASGIFAQRYDSGGNQLGSEFRINTYTAGSQFSPSVHMSSDGGFVAVWESEDQDGSDSGIFAQRYDNAGNELGTEFQVNTYTNGAQASPAISGTSNGDFIVVWVRESQNGSDIGTFGQRYDSAGNTVGAEFRINTYAKPPTPQLAQAGPDVSVDPDGDVVVVWHSGDIEESQDGHGFGIFGRLNP